MNKTKYLFLDITDYNENVNSISIFLHSKNYVLRVSYINLFKRMRMYTNIHIYANT